MSNFGVCSRCGRYGYRPAECSCTKMYFKHESWGEEWQERWHRGDLESFAESLASDDFHEDPTDLKHFEFNVSVKDERGNEKQFVVTGEPEITWSARESAIQ